MRLITRLVRSTSYDAYKVSLRNNAGEIVGLVAISRDVTERKRTEEVLRRAHDELEARVRERTVEIAKANEGLQCRGGPAQAGG